MVTKFKHDQKDLEITEQDVLCVKLAGLCHDLGHGPFSHVFDGVFIPTLLPNSTWTHEQGSEMMFDAALTETDIDLTTDDVAFVKDLIAGTPRTSNGSKYLYEIVANHRNSVDVDKFDYIPRDCYYTGVKQSYDTRRLIQFARVVEDQICFNQKEVYNIYEMVDVLIAADGVFKLSEMFEDPEQYTLLTDAIIREIERSRHSDLTFAQSILRRIRTRDLYDFVDQMIIPTAYRDFISPKNITKSTILRFTEQGDMLTEDDIILDWLVLTYAMKDRNPVDNIKFFGKYNPDEVFTISQDQVSLLIPTQYDECTLRIFCKVRGKSRIVQKAFRGFIESIKRECGIMFGRDDKVVENGNDDGYKTPKRKEGRGLFDDAVLTPNRGFTLPIEYEAIKVARSPVKKSRAE